MEILLLYLLDKMNGGRSLSGAVHILKGKRSSQTIQDISLFRLEKWAAALRYFSYKQVRDSGEYLIKEQLILNTEKNTRLSAKGVQLLQENKVYLNHFHFQGRKYEWNGEAEDFWQRLSLLLQSLSWLQAGNTHFIPVRAEFYNKKLVKAILKENKAEELSKTLENWLLLHLRKVNQADAEMFIARLSGYGQYGLTFQQLGNSERESFFYYLRFRGILHMLLEEKNSLPLSLHGLFPVYDSSKALTISAAETKKLVEKGLPVADISSMRSLKTSTIEDHLVELAMYDSSFPYKHFISADKLISISKAASENPESSSLKQLRTYLNQETSYFEIRLVLALLYQWKEEKDA